MSSFRLFELSDEKDPAKLEYFSNGIETTFFKASCKLLSKFEKTLSNATLAYWDYILVGSFYEAKNARLLQLPFFSKPQIEGHPFQFFRQ